MPITSINELRASAPAELRGLNDTALIQAYAERTGTDVNQVAQYLGMQAGESANAGIAGLKAGGYNLGSLGLSAGAAVADTVGARGLRDSLTKKASELSLDAQLVNRPDLQRIEDVYDSPSKYLPYVANQLGQQIPNLAGAVAAGALVPELAVPAALERGAALLPRFFGGGGLSGRLAAAGGSAAEQAAARTAAEQAGKAFARQATGGAAFNTVQGAGSLYDASVEGGDPNSGGKALLGAPLYGLLETVPETMLVGRLGGGAGFSGRLGSRVLKASGSQAATGATSEIGQTLMENAYNGTLSQEQKNSALLNAGVAGGLVEGLLGGFGGIRQRGKYGAAMPALDDTNGADILNSTAQSPAASQPAVGLNPSMVGAQPDLFGAPDTFGAEPQAPAEPQPAQVTPGNYDLFNPDGTASYAADTYQGYTERNVTPVEARQTLRQYEDALVALQVAQDAAAQDPSAENSRRADNAEQVARAAQQRWETVKQLSPMSPKLPYVAARQQARTFEQAMGENVQRTQAITAANAAAEQAANLRQQQLIDPSTAPPTGVLQTPKAMAMLDLVDALEAEGHLSSSEVPGLSEAIARGRFGAAKKVIDRALKDKAAADSLLAKAAKLAQKGSQEAQQQPAAEQPVTEPPVTEQPADRTSKAQPANTTPGTVAGRAVAPVQGQAGPGFGLADVTQVAPAAQAPTAQEAPEAKVPKAPAQPVNTTPGTATARTVAPLQGRAGPGFGLADVTQVAPAAAPTSTQAPAQAQVAQETQADPDAARLQEQLNTLESQQFDLRSDNGAEPIYGTKAYKEFIGLQGRIEATRRELRDAKRFAAEAEIEQRANERAASLGEASAETTKSAAFAGLAESLTNDPVPLRRTRVEAEADKAPVNARVQDAEAVAAGDRVVAENADKFKTKDLPRKGTRPYKLALIQKVLEGRVEFLRDKFRGLTDPAELRNSIDVLNELDQIEADIAEANFREPSGATNVSETLRQDEPFYDFMVLGQQLDALAARVGTQFQAARFNAGPAAVKAPEALPARQSERQKAAVNTAPSGAEAVDRKPAKRAQELPLQQNLDPHPDEQQAVSQGIAGKDAIGIARWIGDNAPNESYKLIADAVAKKIQEFQAAGVQFDVKVVKVGDLVPRSLNGSRGVSRYVFGNAAKGEKASITVWLNGPTVTGKVGVSYETVLHELVHAALQPVTRLGSYTAAADTPAGKATSRLFAVMDAVVKEFNARVAASKRGEVTLSGFEREMFKNANNAFTNLQETLAWALTNKGAQQFLEGIPYDNKTSLWQAFVTSIRSFLGLPAKADTALSEVLAAASDLFDAKVDDLKEMAGKAGTAMQVQKPLQREAVPEIDTRFNSGAAAALNARLSQEALQRIVAEATAGITNAPSIQVLDNPSQVPGAAVPEGVNPSGAVIGGKVYLFRDNISSAAEALKTVFHELFHFGLDRVLGRDEYNQTMLRLSARDREVSRLALQWKQSEDGQSRKGSMPTQDWNALAVEEALADIAERVGTEGGTALNSTLRNIALWLADVAKSLGLTRLAGNIRNMTLSETEQFVMDTISYADTSVAAMERLGRAGAPAVARAAQGYAANDYAALQGKPLVQEFKVAETGETVQMEMDAAQAMRDMDKRKASLEQLLKCVKG